MDLVFLTALALPWIGAGVIALLPRARDRWANGVALVFAGGGAVLWTLTLPPPHAELRAVLRRPWIDGLGLELMIVRDGLSDAFGALVVWIAFFTLLFARAYLPRANEHEHADRSEASFHALMLAFTGSMLWTVTAGNLLQFYLFWELTGIASYLLIGYWRHLEEARRGALHALGLTTAGGVTMLAGFLWLGLRTGEWSLPTLVAREPFTGPFAEACAALVIAGAVAKSAQFPTSNWLTGAMIAPTPVSAFLHSSALVALGIFLLGRFFPLFHETATWRWALGAVGSIGVVVGGLIAARQVKIKSLLAWSTVAMYAYMMLGFGLGSSTGVHAALYAFFVHAFIKAGLFLVAGVVIHLTGRKELDEVGGLGRTHHMLAIYGVILGLSLGGIPLTGGFYLKEELLKASLENESWFLLGAMFLGEGFSLIYMLRFLNEIFVGPGDAGEGEPFPWLMGVPLAAASGLALLTGLFPNWLAPLGLRAAVTAVLERTPEMTIRPEFSPMFLTSVAVLSVAGLLWFMWRKEWIPRRWWTRLPQAYPLGGARLVARYERLADACVRVHNGELRAYLTRSLALLLVLVVIGAAAAAPSVARLLEDAGPPPTPALPVALAALVLATVANLRSRSYVSFALTLTIIGFSLGAVFLLLRAPSVSLAQVLIEMLATLSIVLALRMSDLIRPDGPPLSSGRPGGPSAARLALSLGVGLTFGLGSYVAISASPTDTVGAWYAENIAEATGAADFVVAILTDFRGFDTLGEILVFVTAVFAVAGLYWRGEVPGE